MARVIAHACKLPDIATAATRTVVVTACALALIFAGKVLPF
jgi:hypothetical protein